METRRKKKEQNALSPNQDSDAMTPPHVVPDSKLQRRPVHSSPNSPKSSPSEKSSHSEELNISSEAASDDSFSKTHSPSEKLSPTPKDEPRSLTNKSRANDSPTPKKDSPKKLDDEHQHKAQLRSYSIFKAILVAVVGLLASFFLFNEVFLKSEPQKDNVMAKVIHRLEKDFANQPKISMIIVKKSLRNVINTDGEPKSPAIILFVSSKGAEKTTNCLVHRLAKEVIETTDESFDDNVDGRSFKKMDPDEIKKEIDDRLEKGVSSPERLLLNVFLIKNIDGIPGKAALIMQKYCDHEDAKYKKAVVLMTISANDDIPKNVTRKEMNVIARSRLNHTWVDLKSDQFDPLYTRISGFISPVLREPDLSEC